MLFLYGGRFCKKHKVIKHNIKPIVEGKGVWWYPENPGPLTLMPYVLQFGSMKFFKVRMDYTMYPHLHPGIGIRFIHSGRYKWVVEGQEVELLPDDLSIINPWQHYGSPYGKTDIGEYTWMVIRPLAYSENTRLNLGAWTKLSMGLQGNLGKMLTHENTIILRKAKKLRKYFVELKNELCKQEVGYEIVVANLIDNFFIDLYRHLSERQQRIESDDNFIDELKTLIGTDLSKKWLIEDLACRFGMGKTKFTDEVKKLTGYPPASFIINLKIEKAIEMLRGEKPNYSDIAYSCGFSSLQHFTSTFSNRIGVSPGKFRKS